MAREEEKNSSISAPGTPKNSGSDQEKKKGIKKLFTFNKNKNPNLDKSTSVRERGSESRRRGFGGLFKRDRSFVDEDALHPTKTDEPQPGNKESLAKDGIEVSKGETKPSTDNPSKGETKPSTHNPFKETSSGEPKLPQSKEETQNPPPKQTQPTIEVSPNAAAQVNEAPKTDVKHVGTSNERPPKDNGAGTEHPPQPENEYCQSLAKGIQAVCLPWTIKKEDR